MRLLIKHVEWWDFNMLCVPYSQFNLILLAYVIIVVTVESIFAYSNSNKSLPIHCSHLAVFDYTVALNTHSDVMSSVRNMFLSVVGKGCFLCHAEVKCLLCCGSLLDDAVESSLQLSGYKSIRSPRWFSDGLFHQQLQVLTVWIWALFVTHPCHRQVTTDFMDDFTRLKILLTSLFNGILVSVV